LPSSSPAATTDPTLPPSVSTSPPAPRIVTCSQRGIVQPKKRTDGSVAWFTACQNNGIPDPTLEPTSHHEARHIPYWRAAMELEF
jgi:hypothetical protein